MNVAVVDLGLGNLASVMQALVRAGGEPRLTDSPEDLARAPRVVLPGVAAFGLGMERVEKFRDAIADVVKRGAPLLGICLGMQLLFEEGEEDGRRRGLGILPGRVTKLPERVQTPHIGWQKLSPEGGWAYFAHSYRCEAPRAIVRAVAQHGDVEVAAIVQHGNVHGAQFHPEKSDRDGDAFLRRFLQQS